MKAPNVDQPTAAPTRKVTAAALGGAIATIAAWGVESGMAVETPAPVVAAFATLFTVAVAYMTKERAW